MRGDLHEAQIGEEAVRLMAIKKTVELVLDPNGKKKVMRCSVCGKTHKTDSYVRTTCVNGCVYRTEEEVAAIQKLRLSLTGAQVEKETAAKLVSLIERLQEEDLLGPEICVIGAELIEIQRQIDEAAKKRNRDVVAEMCASVLRVERVA